MTQTPVPDTSASDGEMARLKRLFERNPTSTIFARLADAYLNAGDVDEAVRVCRRGLKYRPSYVTGHIVLGRSLVQQGHEQAAEDEFQKVLTLEPDNLAAMQYLATISAHQGDLERSSRLESRLYQLNPALGLTHAPDTQQPEPDLQPELEPVTSAAEDHDAQAAEVVPLPPAVSPASGDPERSADPARSGMAEEETEAPEFPFVSLTLARLYARQGHRGQAERVVRLVSPADAEDIMSRISQDSAQ